MKYLSLFSGVGGFELGIQNAIKDWEREGQERTRSLQHIPSRRNMADLSKQSRNWPICVGYSEIDKYAIKVYERNFNGHINYGNATTINAAELPDFDLLVGGFPCQAFSVAGKRHGFNDTRGTLFFDIARILSHKRPKHILLENVKGLLSHDGGKTFQTIIGVLTDLGYVVEWQVLNAKDFGVPQNRERIFIVGHLGGECGRQVFPITGSRQQIATVAGYISEEVWPGRHEQIRRTYNTDGAMPTIPTGQGGGVMTKIHIAAQRGRENGQTLEPQLEDKTNSITSVQKDNLVIDVPRIRRLTPTECERLMSWPDGWTLGSDTQRYKQCGNGVVSNVVEAVITAMCDEGCLQTDGISRTLPQPQTIQGRRNQ